MASNESTTTTTTANAPPSPSLAYQAGRPLSPAALSPPFLHVFNLPSELPSVGLQLEFRDLDFIWCPATVVQVNTKASTVVLRYDGWPDDWDETVPYPNPRLAKMFTYTKRLKAWVKSRAFTGRWPAMVSERRRKGKSDKRQTRCSNGRRRYPLKFSSAKRPSTRLLDAVPERCLDHKSPLNPRSSFWHFPLYSFRSGPEVCVWRP